MSKYGSHLYVLLQILVLDPGHKINRGLRNHWSLVGTGVSISWGGGKNTQTKVALETEIGFLKINEVTRLLKWKISLMSF